MKKILFVEKRLRLEKLGVCYLAAVLRTAGHEVILLQDDLEDVDGYLVQNPQDFVMFSVTSDEASWASQRNRELKAKHRFITAVGGPHPTFVPSWGTDDEAIDYVVQGPGEDVILNIVNGSAERLTRGNLLGRFNYVSPDRNILYKYPEFGQSRMKRFVACRYCLFSCRHCFNSAFKGLYPDQKECLAYRPPVKMMIKEIQEVKREYGLELAFFNDDDIAGDPEWLMEFCELLATEGAGVGFASSIRASSVDQKMIEMMAKAKCSMLNIGLESANTETQKLLRRGPVTNEQVYQATRWCEDAGIKVRLQVMIGLPVENPLEDAMETYEFALKCGATDVSPTIYTPLPGTSLWGYCVEKSLISRDTQTGSYFFKTVLRIPDAEKINRLGKLFPFAFWEKWPTEKLRRQLEISMSDAEMIELTQRARDICKEKLYGI